VVERAVRIVAEDATLDGTLTVPAAARGVVLFAHGSGSSRHSPRNRFVAEELHRAAVGTFLFDLLTGAEEEVDERTREHRFDIALLARRLVGATEWIRQEAVTAELQFGYFGASTGAAAALVAAVERPEAAAVVSRGGRPDLAGAALARMTAPTLLVVGGDDEAVLDLNRQAMAKMPGLIQLEVIPGASHLFPEPGALEAVAQLATAWFTRFFERVSA
jgi:putative phosphoribosyl transferase